MRSGDGPAVARAAAPIRDGADLARLLGVPFGDQQLAAITAPLEPGVVVAGAGTGKTTVMAARVVYLVGTGQVRPDQVLGLTFTNKAAAELGARVRSALGRAGLAGPAGAAGPDDDPGEPTVATYHAFAGRLLADQGLRIGWEPATRLVTDAVRFQLATDVVTSAPGPYLSLRTGVPHIVEQLLTLDEQATEHLVELADILRRDAGIRGWVAAAPARPQPVREIAEAAARRDELVDLVGRLRAAKRARGVCDFADQMGAAARLAESCPEVGRALREQFRVVVLDEYQDTSVAQRRMLAALFSGPTSAAGRGHPVTAVGDPAQSIYGWRGASVANLDEFPAHFPTADGGVARRFPLSVNRRSGTTILAAANALAAPLRAVHTDAQPLQAPPGTAPGRVAVGLFETRQAELAWVAEQVAGLHAADPSLRWSDIAVLARTGEDLAAAHAALLARSVPVEIAGLSGLLQVPEVGDVVATLEVLADLTANAALLRLLAGPRWRIGPRDLALLGRRARRLAEAAGMAGMAAGDAGGGAGGGPARGRAGVAAGDGDAPVSSLDADLAAAVRGADDTELPSLADALDRPGALPYSAAARERFAALAAELAGLRRHAADPLPELARRVVATIGLDVELAALPAAESAHRRANLATFLDAVGEFAELDHAVSLRALLAYLRAAQEHEDGLPLVLSSERDSVKLLTVHRAKGLEWSVVFLPGLSDRVFPSAKGRPRWTTASGQLPWSLRGDAASLPRLADLSTAGRRRFAADVAAHDEREERRLGYVGATRAKRLLVGTGHWWRNAQVKPFGPSPYLLGLRAAAVAAGVAPGPWAPEPPPGSVSPLRETQLIVPWPAAPDPAAVARREAAADLVLAAIEAVSAGRPAPGVGAGAELAAADRTLLAGLDRDLAALLAEQAAQAAPVRDVPLPVSLTTTQAMRLAADPAGLARSLARPMPVAPSRRRQFGTRFHAFVEAELAATPLLDPDELPGAADEGIASDAELAGLVAAFRAGPFAGRQAVGVEVPFAFALGRHVLRGRIDAVFATAGGFDVVDWKTNVEQTADPVQLAIYRQAWAAAAGVPVERVGAAFCYVRTGRVVRPELPDRAHLLALLDGAVVPGTPAR